MLMNKLSGFAGVLMVAAALTACQGKSETAQPGQNQTGGTTAPTTPAAAKPEPVTLKIGFRAAAEADVDIMIAALKKTRPEITIEKLPPSNTIAEMLARGDKPDLLQFAWTELVSLSETGLALDMTPYLKPNNIELSSFRDGFIDNLRGLFLKPEQLIALQYYTNTGLQFYNKDIFNRFGVEYPKDGMTWEETTELARKVTRNEGGVQYQGLEARDSARLDDIKSQLGLSFVDKATGKSAFMSDGWKYMLETLLKPTQIPGNDKSLGTNGFNKTFQVAMLPWRDSLMGTMFDIKNFSWDIATFPTFAKAPGINTNYAGPLVAMTSISAHKDQAFQFIKAALSEDVQKQMAAMLRMPVVKGLDSFYGSSYPQAASKNLSAVFKLKPGPNPYVHAANAEGRKILGTTFQDIAAGKDVNTALREADEKLNLAIQQAAGK
ncbi:MAG: transporter substrate-binding protein [Paenibacillus sp.]|jgi:multiple sugar transport system substrate-binding protein|nr:transporter substrate-binding protein [Paenibacillus sp.]